MDLTINKIAAGVVGFAMVAGLALAFTATKAHAVSLSELVELLITSGAISEDKADEARAAATAAEETATEETATLATAVSCSFTRNLKTGDTGQDVMDLQKLLNANGYVVSTTGAGSAGQETQYYGPATAAAVSKLQMAYAAEILTPLGLTNGTGFFGASTRAKANALCADEETTADEDTTTTDEDTNTDTENTDLSGEASLNITELDSADDDEIEEGDEEAPIADVTLEFADGDAMITRLDISLVGSGSETDPWDTFDTIALMVDDEVVAEMDATDEKEYLDEDAGEIRFTGLDIIANEDEEVVVTVVATVQGSVDGTSDGEAWEVNLLGVRYVDGDDVTSTEDITVSAVDFTINEAGEEDEIIVKTSSSDLDSSIIKAESDSKSDWVTVFVFDLDTDDSESDISIDSIPVSVTVSSSTYNGIVADARLVIDGTTIDSTSADVAGGTTATGVITFDVDGDVVIDAGDRVAAELQLRFNALAEGDEGDTVYGAVTSANALAIDAEGADDIAGGGAATGEAHQLLTAGIYAEIVSVDEESKSSGSTDDALGEYTIKVDVTAFENEYFISATTTTVFDFDIEDSNGTASTTLTALATAAVSSGAERVGDAYQVNEGDTETFTVTISVDPTVAGYYRAQLNSIDFGTSATDTTDEDAHTVSPAEDFETDNLYLNA